MINMQEIQISELNHLLAERMEHRFKLWLQEKGYQECAFLEKYRDEELVLQYEIGGENTRIYLVDSAGDIAEIICEFPTERIEESRDLVGEVTLRASWIAWVAMDKLYGEEHNRLRRLPESADCGLAENIRREYEGLRWRGMDASGF